MASEMESDDAVLSLTGDVDTVDGLLKTLGVAELPAEHQRDAVQRRWDSPLVRPATAHLEQMLRARPLIR